MADRYDGRTTGPRLLGQPQMSPPDHAQGHIESSSLKKQHAEAVKASGVVAFVLYTFRHTCITRWEKQMDPFTLHVLAGQTDMNSNKQYVHPRDDDILEAMEKSGVGRKYGHTLKTAAPGCCRSHRQAVK